MSLVLRYCLRHDIPKLVLGRGSNLLVRDGGFRGVVIAMTNPAFARIERQDTRLICGAGAKLKAVAVEGRRHGLAGLEFLEGIPGTVGGGLRMNAGAMGSMMFEVVESARFMDAEGHARQAPAQALGAEYRACPWFVNHVALSAVLVGKPDTMEHIEQRMKEYSRKRWDSQPTSSSAGCIFKNPISGPAGKQIDELGLKGRRIGGAMVSLEHGNFIVNTGHATAGDVLELIAVVKESVLKARGVDLRLEVEVVGED